MGEIKHVTYKHLKKGQKVNGAETVGESHGFVGYVKEANAAYVILEMWRPGGREERYSSEWLFGIEMTDEEFRGKYNRYAGEVLKAIQNTMNRDEIGYHEMWNGWLSSNPWELAQACKAKKIEVIGHCKDIVPKTAMFSGDTLDVGVCAEYEDGERFWCHFKSEDIKTMIHSYERYQKYLKEGKAKEYDFYEAKYEYMEEKERKNAD